MTMKPDGGYAGALDEAEAVEVPMRHQIAVVAGELREGDHNDEAK